SGATNVRSRFFLKAVFQRARSAGRGRPLLALRTRCGLVNRRGLLMSATVSDDRWLETPPPAELAASGAPWIETEEVPFCPVCGGERSAPYPVGFDYELLPCRTPWRFVRCGECGHVWLTPRPAIEALSVISPPTYYAYNYRQQINPVAL